MLQPDQQDGSHIGAEKRRVILIILLTILWLQHSDRTTSPSVLACLFLLAQSRSVLSVNSYLTYNRFLVVALLHDQAFPGRGRSEKGRIHRKNKASLAFHDGRGLKHHLWQNIAHLPQEDSEKLFSRYFRMNAKTFDYVLKRTRHLYEPDAQSFRPDTLSSAQRLATVLLRLGSTGEGWMTGDLMGYSEATVSQSVLPVCQAIVDVLGPLHVRMPDDSEIMRKIEKFETERKGQHPMCLGAVDGKLFFIP